MLDAKVKAKDWSIPQAFGAYATELGLTERQYFDVLADWREKINRAGEPPWLASQLCRFIEQKAGKLDAAVKSAAAAPARERREDWA
ncbi:MAG TPA: hypothetical protein VHP33_20050 [Polyangiaceae bacterium]|nr:hypothetical protein [Polyangiaceae bacterium]